MPLKRQLVEVRSSVEAKPYEARGVTQYLIDTTFVTDDGMPVRLQKRGFDTRGEAILWAEREITLIKTGAKPIPARHKKSKPIQATPVTTRQAFDRLFAWWEESGRKRASTISVEKYAVERHLLPILGDVPWADVTQQQVDALVRGNGQERSNRFLITLRMAVRYSSRVGLTPPAVSVDYPFMQSRERMDFITAQELDLICSQTKPSYAHVFRLLWNTGLRIGEFLALEWSDLDLRPGMESLTVRRTAYFISKQGFAIQPPKNGKQRTIPLNHAAVIALTALRAHFHGAKMPKKKLGAELRERLVYPGKNNGYASADTFSLALRNACDAAGLRRISPHILRHSFASNLVQAGVDLYTVSTLLGHSSVAMTQRYSHLPQDGLRRATCTLDQISAQPPVAMPHESVNIHT